MAGARRGRHLLRRTDTYEASLAPWFDRFLLPDGRPRRVLVLGPDALTDPHSSLSFMLQWAVERRGTSGSRFLWTPEGPDCDGLLRELARAREDSTPVLLLSTARSLEALLEPGPTESGSLGLPENSVVMETGGPKRSGLAFERGSFHERIAAALAVSPSSVVSEYGMTELGSQGYAPGFLASLDSEASPRFGDVGSDLHVFPPWCRVRSLDPDSLDVLPAGRRGLLCFWDLSNVDSALAVLTADEGIVRDQGVELLGRAAGATPRGCSLAVDEILSGVAP